MKSDTFYKTQFCCPECEVGIHPECWFLLHDIERYKYLRLAIYASLSSITFPINSNKKSVLAKETIPINNFQFKK